jgi:hypothetical protein
VGDERKMEKMGQRAIQRLVKVRGRREEKKVT